MVAHWVVLAAGIFVVAASALQFLLFQLQYFAFGADRALHDTYYVVGSKGYVPGILAVVFATAVICWGLRRLAHRLENED